MLLSLECNFLVGDPQLSPGSLVLALQSLLQCNFHRHWLFSFCLGALCVLLFWFVGLFLLLLFCLFGFVCCLLFVCWFLWCFFLLLGGCFSHSSVTVSHVSSLRAVCQEKPGTALFPGL